MSNIQVGQRIWFESEIFTTGKNVEKVLGEGQTNGVKRYDGEVLRISGLERSWIRFSVGVAGQEGFQLWLPICWTALGFTLCAHHYWLCN